ncbi:MAG: indole-3-glycerol phosphate synthase TrpC [Acidiferrobacter sp.]
MADVLRQILADKVGEVVVRRRDTPLAILEDRIRQLGAARGFRAALTAQVAAGHPAVIAEIKRASPSRGVLRAGLDPAVIAHSYEHAGATALSVLTDHAYFGGAAQDLVAARAACRLPVLRKDFIVDPYQVAESRAMGADALLLIVAALDPGRLQEIYACAVDTGIDVLIEVHDRAELEQALALPLGVIGINNRDLRTFVTQIETTVALMAVVPADRWVITESGIRTPQDVEQLWAAGVRGFLVGETFMVAPDPGIRLAQLFGGVL